MLMTVVLELEERLGWKGLGCGDGLVDCQMSMRDDAVGRPGKGSVSFSIELK